MSMKTQAIIKKVKYFPEELMRIYLDTKYYGTTRIMFNLVNILILFGAVTILILPHIYFWDKHRLDEMNSFSISYIALQILVFIICLWILSIRDNKRYRNVGIKTGRFFIRSDARNEFVDKKFNFFYKELVSSAILTGNKEKDILRLKQYIPFIDEEKKFWYSIPAVYIGTVFVLLMAHFGQQF